MRRTTLMAVAVLMLLGLTSTNADAGMMLRPEEAGVAKLYMHFYNWLRDDDGDGIPNCLDPDYVKPEDGTGFGKVKGYGYGECDEDCDGTPDRIRDQIRLHINDGRKTGVRS